MNEEMPATTPRLEYWGPSSALSSGTPRMTAGREGTAGGWVEHKRRASAVQAARTGPVQAQTDSD